MLKRQIGYAFKVQGNRIRRKDLRAVVRFALALNAVERDTRIKEIDSSFGFMKPEQQDYLRAVYTRSYTKGFDEVEKDIFSNSSSAAYNEVIDRFADSPKVETPDWDFILKVSKGDRPSLEEILGASDQKGFEEDFSYYIYQKYYIDGARELEQFDVEVAEGLKEDDVYFLSDLAYADGVEARIDELAREAVRNMAEELLEDKP